MSKSGQDSSSLAKSNAIHSGLSNSLARAFDRSNSKSLASSDGLSKRNHQEKQSRK